MQAGTMGVKEDRPLKLLTVKQAAESLGVSMRMVWRLIGEAELDRVNVGRCCRVPLASLEAFIAKGGVR